jgi:glutathione S-transferase
MTMTMPNPAPPDLHLFELADPGDPGGVESYSPFCLKVNRALQMRGLSYQRHHLDRPDAHGLTETGQVPVLVIGDPRFPDREVIADSTAILRRIGELTGRRFEPEGRRARAEAWLYEELADTALNGFLVAARWADDRNWPAVREAYFGKAPWPVRTLVAPRLRAWTVKALNARDIWRAGPDACWARFERLIDQLEGRAPELGFWVSNEITAADLGLFGQLACLRTDLTPWQRSVVEARPTLCRYLDRVDAASRPRRVQAAA